MDDGKLIGLVLLCVPLSLLSFGGGQTIIAGLQHQSVGVQGWMTESQFADIFAISRAAPGPSTLIVALIGWQVAGFAGALVATLAIFIPSSALLCLAGRWWQRHRGSALTDAIERGLAPIAVGLIFAGALAIAHAANLSALNAATIACVASLLYFTKVGPYAILALVASSYAVIGLLAGVIPFGS